LLPSAEISFESGRAPLKPDSHTLLNSISNIAKRCPEARFEVAGHTDAIGDLTSNMALSTQRAQAVIAHLVALGLNAKQFSAKGYGPSQPLSSNDTEEGRTKNRRIEFKLNN
jgi:OOP family OmpA-OmpF porin